MTDDESIKSSKGTCATKQGSRFPKIVGTEDDLSLKLLRAISATKRESLFENGVFTENAM